MRKEFKKLTAVAVAGVLSAGTLAALAGCGGSDDPNKFTIYMGSSVPEEFYIDYGENPFAQYLEKKFDIELEFTFAAVGKENEDFGKKISSGSYYDVMDISYYQGVVADLYDDGYGAAMDLTQYINDYMPNYKAFLEAPENAETVKYAKSDGKYLTINNYNEEIPAQWGGWLYRRDWLVKYDGNPDTPDENGMYKDGVRFPDGYLDENGYDNPVTLNDWEYMFGIFEKAPDYEYAITLPSTGYHSTGELVSAFGIDPLWFFEKGESGAYDQVAFGGASDQFRQYVETMHEWYEKGWLDKNFGSNAGDQFFELDAEHAVSGEVGMWYGIIGQAGNILEQNDEENQVPALDGIDLWGARQPKLTADSPDPTCFYLDSKETTRRWIVTDAATDKNLEKLFTMLDWLYSEEGAITKFYGLSKEQMEEYDIDTSLYERYGLDKGCYWYALESDIDTPVAKDTPGAVLVQNPIVINDSGYLPSAVSGSYFFGLGYDDLNKAYFQKGESKSQALREWAALENPGTIRDSLRGLMDSDTGLEYKTIQNKIIDAMGLKVPDMIKDGVNDTSWALYVSDIKSNRYDKAENILKDLIASLNH